MKKLIVIADWGYDLLTCQEVRSAVEGAIEAEEYPHVTFVGSEPSTVHTSYLINQVVEVEERYGKPEKTVLFQNTDPRIQTKTAVEKAKGAEFVVIKLKSGMYLCGPNAGYDFSLIKHKIEKVWLYKNMDKGSQFRSRDLYAKASAQLMEDRIDEMDLEEMDLSEIPDITGGFIGHIDNYGNVKTTFTLNEFKQNHEFGDMVEIEINNIKQQAKFVSNLFGGTPGELVIYPGSSGQKDNPFLEISVWRHFTEEEATTGIHAFHNPRPGMEIAIH